MTQYFTENDIQYVDTIDGDYKMIDPVENGE